MARPLPSELASGLFHSRFASAKGTGSGRTRPVPVPYAEACPLCRSKMGRPRGTGTVEYLGASPRWSAQNENETALELASLGATLPPRSGRGGGNQKSLHGDRLASAVASFGAISLVPIRSPHPSEIWLRSARPTSPNSPPTDHSFPKANQPGRWVCSDISHLILIGFARSIPSRTTIHLPSRPVSPTCQRSISDKIVSRPGDVP